MSYCVGLFIVKHHGDMVHCHYLVRLYEDTHVKGLAKVRSNRDYV